VFSAGIVSAEKEWDRLSEREWHQEQRRTTFLTSQILLTLRKMLAGPQVTLIRDGR